jgi:glutathione S-transferase
MTTLYYSPGTASLVVHWLLIELDVPHTLHRLDLEAREHKAAAYLAINPAGVVPALVVDGAPITEAVAIVMHLADAHPSAALAPPLASPERAAYYQWLCFMANTLQPAYRAWFYPDEPAGADHADVAKAVARSRIEGAWAHAAPGPYLAVARRIRDADESAAIVPRAVCPRRTHRLGVTAVNAPKRGSS